MLTAADGEGQQCIAAPAWIASREPEMKGSLAISALTNIKFLKIPIHSLSQVNIKFRRKSKLIRN